MFAKINEQTSEFLGESFQDTGISLPSPKNNGEPWYSPAWDSSNMIWIEGKSKSEIDNLNLESNSLEITEKANEIILGKYSELKQRKLISMAITLQDKQLDGVTLTPEELALKQYIKDVNDWITSVRNIENSAISLNTDYGLVDWSSV